MLAASGMDAIPVEDGAAALALLERERVHVALVDLMMPKMNGLELLENLRTSHPEVEVIMMTAFGDVEVAVKSVRAGAYDFLEKPFRSNDEVILTVSKAAERRRLLTRTEMLERKLEQKENVRRAHRQHHQHAGGVSAGGGCSAYRRPPS
jgi:DNA-binding NtrC family response regulator